MTTKFAQGRGSGVENKEPVVADDHTAAGTYGQCEIEHGLS